MSRSWAVGAGAAAHAHHAARETETRRTPLIRPMTQPVGSQTPSTASARLKERYVDLPALSVAGAPPSSLYAPTGLKPSSGSESVQPRGELRGPSASAATVLARRAHAGVARHESIHKLAAGRCGVTSSPAQDRSLPAEGSHHVIAARRPGQELWSSSPSQSIRRPSRCFGRVRIARRSILPTTSTAGATPHAGAALVTVVAPVLTIVAPPGGLVECGEARRQACTVWSARLNCRTL
eukprot:scaffold140_cov565-Prasinococcus_capsulatus_cf.AAC.14